MLHLGRNCTENAYLSFEKGFVPPWRALQINCADPLWRFHFDYDPFGRLCALHWHAGRAVRATNLAVLVDSVEEINFDQCITVQLEHVPVPSSSDRRSFRIYTISALAANTPGETAHDPSFTTRYAYIHVLECRYVGRESLYRIAAVGPCAVLVVRVKVRTHLDHQRSGVGGQPTRDQGARPLRARRKVGFLHDRLHTAASVWNLTFCDSSAFCVLEHRPPYCTYSTRLSALDTHNQHYILSQAPIPHSVASGEPTDPCNISILADIKFGLVNIESQFGSIVRVVSKYPPLYYFQ
ncbi:hypothetical protein AG1IA_01598 [Rhizoctonia solani AG-1 IA]|uniref:Uncharacterized protein n=1 Tax=Thanatephorus cucumeris (strain AG1-IA) TaxID=983506 RepID=L8X246_THACA|nr:hypothetical protein AG1IA_01598 [Rhizoctonia solani AG-1 IA]